MKYIHVKKLEEYHPGYKDRSLIWCKAYFKMMNTDPDFEMLCETDKWRFIAFVMLELQMQEPIPMNEEWLTRKGFNLKKRSISLTLQMLHNSIEVVTEGGEVRNETVTQSRVEKSRVEESRVEKETPLFWDYFLLKTKKKYTLNSERKDLIRKRLSEHSLDDLKRVVDNFVADDWAGRSDNLDLIYCIGKQKGKPDNLEKWLNIEGKNEKGEKLRPGTTIPEKYFNKKE